MVVKMALNAPRVAKITYYTVVAKYERPTTGIVCVLLASITGIMFLAIQSD